MNAKLPRILKGWIMNTKKLGRYSLIAVGVATVVLGIWMLRPANPTIRIDECKECTLMELLLTGVKVEKGWKLRVDVLSSRIGGQSVGPVRQQEIDLGRFAAFLRENIPAATVYAMRQEPFSRTVVVRIASDRTVENDTVKRVVIGSQGSVGPDQLGVQ